MLKKCVNKLVSGVCHTKMLTKCVNDLDAGEKMSYGQIVLND